MTEDGRGHGPTGRDRLRALLGPAPLYTLDEACERSGLSREFLCRDLLALGLSRPDPGEEAFTEHDVTGLSAVAGLLAAGLSEESVLELARVNGHGAARLAATVLEVALELLADPPADRLESLLVGTQGGLEEVLGPLVEVPLRLHLRDLLRREAGHEGALAAGGTRLVTVCFVDLVGFTALSLAASPGELGELAHGFETAAVEAAVPPVQLVKLLGDGALFVCPEPEPMVAAAQALIGRLAARRALPGARAGLALGRAVRHAGDWYGPVVNLASRIEAAGEPGAVTAERRVVETTSRSWMWEPLGSRRLPGDRGRGGAVPAAIQWRRGAAGCAGAWS